MFETIATAVFVLVTALPAVYLAFLAAVTTRARPLARDPRDVSRRVVFAVLVPAHDEQLLIGRTVASLVRIDYPSPLFSVHVVADNCRDDTAAHARASGACVHRRSEAARPGKAAALNWLVNQVAEEVPNVDAFVFVDADSRVSAGFLHAMARSLRSGAQVVQALNLVDVASDSGLVRLRELAFQLHCHLQPLAHQILGGSSGLYGNGMCLSAALCRRLRWNESSVVEDGDMFFRIIREGHRIALAPDAWVRSVMPAKLRGAAAQAVRWELGRLEHLRQALPLLWTGLRRSDPNALFAGIGVFVPPVGVLAVMSGLGLVLGALTRTPVLFGAALVSLVSLALYAWRGVLLGGMPPRVVLRVLLWAPAYAIWKVWIVACAAAGRGRREWSATTRAGGG